MTTETLPHYTKFDLPFRRSAVMLTTTEIPGNALMIIKAFASRTIEDALDLACIINEIEDIPHIDMCSELDIDYALALLLTNYDTLLSPEERESIISEYEMEGYCVAYEERQGLWYAATSGASFSTMVVLS